MLGILQDLARQRANAAAGAGGLITNAGNYAAENPQTVGLLAGQFAPSAGYLDFSGKYPDPFNPTQLLPSASQNFRQGKFFDAGAQTLGLIGDAMYAAAPFTFGASSLPAMALAVPRATQLANRSERGLASVDLPAGSFPEYTGAATNRAEGSYPRYTPKNIPPRMARLIGRTEDPDDPIFTTFDKYIEKGKSLQGEDWYNTEEMRDWFVSQLGEERGDAEWRDFIGLIGATSTGSKVPQNLRNATFYRALNPEQRAQLATRVAQGGITPKEALKELGIEIANLPDNYRYGHKMQSNQAKNVLALSEGDWNVSAADNLTGAEKTEALQANPKVKGFMNSLLGDEVNIAEDKHFMRMLAMSDGGVDFLSDKAELSQENIAKIKKKFKGKIDPYINVRDVKGKKITTVNLKKAGTEGVITDTKFFNSMPTAWTDTPKKNEYAAFEEMANRIAPNYNMTPAQFQASLWMGAGDLTGLADESQGTAMELFRRTLDKRAGERGLTRKEMLEDFIVNKAPLAVPLTAGGATGLLMNQEQDPDNNVGLMGF